MDSVSMTPGLIYGLMHISERKIRYVGQTRSTRRFAGHKAAATRGVQYPVYDWMRKHGNDQIIEVVIEIIDDVQHLDEREKHWISKYNTYIGDNLDGLNCTRGGSGDLTRPKSASAKEAMSTAQKKRYQDPAERLKLGQRDYYRDPDYRKRVSDRVTVEKNTSAAKEAQARAMRDWWANPVNKEKRLSQYREHWDDPEYWKKMGERAYYKDPEWRKGQAEAGKLGSHKYWHERRGIIKPGCSYCEVSE